MRYRKNNPFLSCSGGLCSNGALGMDPTIAPMIPDPGTAIHTTPSPTEKSKERFKVGKSMPWQKTYDKPIPLAVFAFIANDPDSFFDNQTGNIYTKIEEDTQGKQWHDMILQWDNSDPTIKDHFPYMEYAVKQYILKHCEGKYDEIKTPSDKRQPFPACAIIKKDESDGTVWYVIGGLIGLYIVWKIIR